LVLDLRPGTGRVELIEETPQLEAILGKTHRTAFERGRRKRGLWPDEDPAPRSKEQRPPSGVAVFPLYSSTVYSACRHLHRMALCRSDRGSSNDSASIVGRALERIFQPLRDQIDHHIPSCTAVVLVEAHTPNHKAAKALIHRDQVLRLVLKPGRMLAPSRLRAHRRKGADVRKFAEPSDDLHHIACLSSARACCSLRRRPRLRVTLMTVLRQPRQPVSCLLSFKNVPSLTKAVKQPNGHPNSVQQGAAEGVGQFRRMPRSPSVKQSVRLFRP
jgi:hypothetical protein